MKNWKQAVVVISFSVMLFGCGEANISKIEPNSESSTVKGKSEESAAENDTQQKQQEIFQIGDSVQFDKLVLTVNGVRNSEGKFLTASEGNVVILVDLTAENTGDKEASVSSMLQTEMVDGDGFSYNVTIAEDGKGSFDGSIGAGRKLRGEIAFEVPEDASTLEFIFNEPFKSGQAIWKIK